MEEKEKLSTVILQPPSQDETDEDIQNYIKIEENNENSSRSSNQNWKPVDSQTEYFSTTEEKINFLIPSSQPQSRPPETILIPSLEPKKETKIPIFHYEKNPTEYTIEEIQRAADRAVSGKSISSEDPFFISEVIEELTSRRIELIANSEYKKAQVMVNAIARIREQFRAEDYKRFRANYLQNLIERSKQQQETLKEVQRNVKQQVKEKKENIKQELMKIQEKQEKEREELITLWQNPSKLRQYNKQSPELLKNKALEKCLALAGELDYAEELKHQNRRMEKREIHEKYQLMNEEFQKAQNKLEIELEQQLVDAKKELEFEVIATAESGRLEIERAKIKADLLQKMVHEEQQLQTRTPRITMSHSAKIPMLQRTVQNVSMKNKIKNASASRISASPLALPPLIIKPRKKKSISVLLK